ncbi:unnamed protein product [Ilex paraguariensis]|uniref:Uncharacterized protein n=1 Tax=Ilex paraguariensis TaxID=185542 RepID=A0ABC8QTC0_9AQUA
MQSPCINACKFSKTSSYQHQFLRFYAHPHSLSSASSSSLTSVSSIRRPNSYPCVSCSFSSRPSNRGKSRERNGGNSGERVKAKGKDNVWSVDNERAKVVEKERERGGRRRKREGKRVRRVVKKSGGDRVMVSGVMLMEVETVLQTQEPVILPAWNTFASSVSGIWKGVGAVFSPITAEMEPIEVGNRNENLFDCYTFSRIEVVPSPSREQKSQIQRKINWVTLNPYGESKQLTGGGSKNGEKSILGDASLLTKEASGGGLTNHVLPKFESFDYGRSDVMEEDHMDLESGLVFFEDGSYSRGPADIPVGEVEESKYYLSPTIKFEQCLVKGCHKRLRIVHTIEFSNGGSDIQIMRVAVYEEQWVSPANLPEERLWFPCNHGPKGNILLRVKIDLELDSKPFSQRKRVQPSELTGSWKVFEVSATPIYSEDILTEESNSLPYVYLCTETLKKRSLPENPVYFGEEEMLDMQNVTVLWLPGGVTGYVDVNKDGVLCIGVGWYSDEGINLVMERDYGVDGKLKEVRWKTEVKRRWSHPSTV